MAFRTCLAGFLLCGAVTAAAPASAAEVKISDTARKHFNAGVALLRDPDGARYEEAYGEFKVAYDASPSWKILGNLGIAAMKLERDGEAIDAFSRYLAEGKKDIDASERADIERDLGTLRASAVSLMLTTTPAEVKITDQRSPVQGTPIINRYDSQAGQLRLQIRPGHHVIVATLEGKAPLRFEFDAAPGSTQQHDFNFTTAEPVATSAPPPSTPTPAAPPLATGGRPVPTGVWIGLAATGAFAIGAGVTGVMALGKNSDYQAANGHDLAKAKSLQDDTKTFNLVTDVLIGAAVVSAGVTTFLYLRRPEQEAAGLELRVSPSVGLHQSGLNLQGTF
jgi:hypothetical protein